MSSHANTATVSWKLKIANAHLLTGRRSVLIDTGPESAGALLSKHLARADVAPGHLGAVLLTHGHADHAGGTAALTGSNVPVVLGTPDRSITELGRNPALVPTGPGGRLVKRFIDPDFPPFTATVHVDDRIDLDEFGIEGEYRVVGGHTAGSAIIATPGVLVVGDLVRGGFAGGSIAGGFAQKHYFSDDPARDLAIVVDLIDEYRPSKVLLGHGGPLDASTARRRIDKLAQR
jgi:hydroxyacylglutathione hydrolase